MPEPIYVTCGDGKRIHLAISEGMMSETICGIIEAEDFPKIEEPTKEAMCKRCLKAAEGNKVELPEEWTRKPLKDTVSDGHWVVIREHLKILREIQETAAPPDISKRFEGWSDADHLAYAVVEFTRGMARVADQYESIMEQKGKVVIDDTAALKDEGVITITPPVEVS